MKSKLNRTMLKKKKNFLVLLPITAMARSLSFDPLKAKVRTFLGSVKSISYFRGDCQNKAFSETCAPSFTVLSE